MRLILASVLARLLLTIATVSGDDFQGEVGIVDDRGNFYLEVVVFRYIHEALGGHWGERGERISLWHPQCRDH